MDKIAGINGSALGGIQTGLRKLHRAAHDVATAGAVKRAEPPELVDPLLDALAAQRAIEASAKALERADQALGSLLDTFA